MCWCAHVALRIAAVIGWSKSSGCRSLADAYLLSRKFISDDTASIAALRSRVALLFLFALRT